MTEFVGRGEID